MSVDESKLPNSAAEDQLVQAIAEQVISSWDNLQYPNDASKLWDVIRDGVRIAQRAEQRRTEQPNSSAPELDCVCGDAKAAHQGQMGFGPCIVNCCGCREYRPKQANGRAEITDAQAAVAFAALFYAEADYPKELGKYENGCKSVKRALQRAVDHGPGNCGKETCFGCYRR